MRRDTTKTKFYNKDGSLTAYSFICGYMEKHDEQNMRFTLELDCVYHVRVFNYKQKTRLCWITFEANELEKARKYFYNELKVRCGLNKSKYLKNAK